MTVYADVLIFINMFVNFFILRLTARLCREELKICRTIFASFIGALFSLYIFLPLSDVISQSAIKLVTSAVITLSAFKFVGFKPYFRRLAVFFASSFLYAGFMMGIWYLLKPRQMAVNNGIVYFNVSPLVLIGVTVVTYIALSAIRHFSQRNAPVAERCELNITANGHDVKAMAIIDTGNSLTDCTDGSNVIVIDKKVAEKLFKAIPDINSVNTKNMPNGFRIIPFAAIGGSGLLPAFKPDKVTANINDIIYNTVNITIAISNESLGADYSAIIGPDSFADKSENLKKITVK